jgi:hypothetical protein
MEFKKTALTEWLEDVVRVLMSENVVSGAFVAKLENGSTYTAYFHAGCCDKVELASHIQADAILDAATAKEEGEKGEEQNG